MSLEDLIKKCTELAAEISDGHFTLCKFTTNWRAGFYTPYDTLDIQGMVKGDTAEEALKRLLEVRVTAPTKEQRIEIQRRYDDEAAAIFRQ